MHQLSKKIFDQIQISRNIAHSLICLFFIFSFSHGLLAQDNSEFTKKDLATDHDTTRISSLLDREQVSNFGDNTIEEALKRFSGVHTNRYGNFNLRGTGLSSYSLMVDGLPLATTGLGTRSYHPDAFSSALFSGIEYVRIIPPDMHANSLGGAINLHTYKPKATETSISFGVDGGFNPDYLQQTGALGNIWIRYNQPLSDVFTLNINANYQKDHLSAESLNLNYGTEDFGSGAVEVLEQINPSLHLNSRDQAGGTLTLDYNPSQHSSFYLTALINSYSLRNTSHSNSWFANESWTDPQNTGTQSQFHYILDTEDVDIQQYLVQAGGEQDFENVIVSYKAGWSHSNIISNYHQFPFVNTGHQYTINNSNRETPLVSSVGEAPELDDMMLGDMTYINDHHIHNRLSGDIKVEVPFDFGKFTAGGNVISSAKDANESGAYSEYLYTYRGFLTMNGFEQIRGNTADLFSGNYRLNWLLDADNAVAFFESSIPNMRLEQDDYHYASDIWNYLANENIYSGFGMAEFTLGKIEFITGVRYEYTTGNYEGRIVEFNRFGQYEATRDTSVNSNNSIILPHAQLIYDLTASNKIRLAYSRTASRANFDILSPFNLINPQDSSFFRGNPDLGPTVSDNLDLIFDSKYHSGKLSIGLFYKNISDQVFLETQPIQVQEGEYQFYDDLFNGDITEIQASNRTYTNSSTTSSLYGAEVTLLQQLDFLPGVLSNFGTYATYTWTDSDFNNPQRENIAFPGLRPHVVNAAVFYKQEQLFAQVSAHWSSEALVNLAEEESLMPQVGSAPVYPDYFEDGLSEISATLKYSINEFVQLWANIRNFISADNAGYIHQEELYPSTLYNRNGTDFRMGLKVSL